MASSKSKMRSTSFVTLRGSNATLVAPVSERCFVLAQMIGNALTRLRPWEGAGGSNRYMLGMVKR